MSCRSVPGLVVLLFVVGEAFSRAAPDCEPLKAIPPECEHILFNDVGHLDALEHTEWMKHVNKSGGSWYNISVADATVYQTGLIDMLNFGNALNPYWYARALAYFGGWSYRMLPAKPNVRDWYTTTYWLRYLPKYVERNTSPNVTALKALCNQCRSFCLFNPELPEAVRVMHPIIRKEIRESFEQWEQATPGFRRPTFHSSDVVIQDRCDDMTLLYNPHYGPPAFRFYQMLATYNARNIYIIRDKNLHNKRPESRPGPIYVCQALHAALCNHLSFLTPNSTLHSVGFEDVSEDFARLLYGPTIFRGISSFSFWSGLANDGEVYSTLISTSEPFRWQPFDLGPRWHWVDVPVLDRAAAGKLPGPKLNYSQTHRIIGWLLEN